MYLLGVSNAVAGGMMIAACVSLTREGCHDSGDIWSTIFGFFLGILFILITKNALSQYVRHSLAPAATISYCTCISLGTFKIW